MTLQEEFTTKIIEALQGTCESQCGVFDYLFTYGSEEFKTKFSTMTEDDIDWALVDQHIFCCETCSWWCEICEMDESGEWVCRDCAEE